MKKSILFIFIFAFSLSTLLAQTFTNIEAGIPGLKYSSASAWGDFDNDGLLDLVVCGEPDGGVDTTLLYHNGGDLGFAVVPGTGFIDVSLGDVEWGDFNNDSYLDLLIVGYNNFISVAKLYINNGNGTFTEQASTGIPGVYMGDIDFADYNNDGYLDIGILGFDNSYVFITKVYQNNQDLTFTEQSGVTLEGLNFGKFKWGDYNNDGFVDFVINGFGDESYVTELWKNNGGGVFTEATSVNLHQGWLGDMAWGDYDVDGDLDLVISGTGGDGSERYTIIYTNNGDESFTEEPSLFFPKVSHSSLEWADFDGDQDLDLFISGTLDAMGTGNYVGEIHYNNDGNFSQTEEILAAYWGDCKVADYDNSGFPDIFICGYDVSENGLAEIFNNDRVLSVNSVKLSSIQLGPIPAQDAIHVSSEQLIISYNLYQLTGEEIMSKKVTSKQFEIDIHELSAGAYLLKLNSQNGDEIQKITVL